MPLTQGAFIALPLSAECQYYKTFFIKKWFILNTKKPIVRWALNLAPRAGLEPATNGLTVRCSTN